MALSPLNRSDNAFPSSSRPQSVASRAGLGSPARPRGATSSLLGDYGRDNGPVVELGSPPRTPNGRAGPSSPTTKAERLREWRAGRGRAPFPEHLLLRDALYLLQGIDGRYVRFALAPAAESNPYLSEKGKEGDGTGFPLGKAGAAAPPPASQEIVGIDIVADEPKVGDSVTF